MTGSPLLEVRNITKLFPGVTALDNVNISLQAGEVLGILGENGAGKSTLIKIISGIYEPDGGTILMLGKGTRFSSPYDSLKSGIRTIYQEMNCFDSLTVAENVFAGAPLRTGLGLVDWNAMKRKAQEVLGQFDSKIDPLATMEDLSIVERQIVEIAKAIHEKAKILIMDEPTSALQEKDVAKLYDTVRKLKANNTAVIYITHRIDEVLALTDRITVLRDGKGVGEVITKDANEKEIVGLILGKSPSEIAPGDNTISRGSRILEVQNLTYSDKLKDISFDLYSGEILAFFGLLGSGVYQLLQVLFGYFEGASGRIVVDGKDVRIDNPVEAKKRGMAYIPFSRKDEGLGLNLSIADNILAANVENIGKGIVSDARESASRAQRWMKSVNIKATDSDSIVNTLSGGNQQKVVISRWLECSSKIFLMGDPMRGIDVGAKAEVFHLIQDLCRSGAGVIFISSEVKEVVSYSHRVIVLKNGSVIGGMSTKDTTSQELLHLAAG